MSKASRAAATDPARILHSDWTLRVQDRLGGPTWIAFTAAVAFITILSVAYRVVAGDPPGMPRSLSLFGEWYIWLDILLGVITGYLWTANGLLNRGLHQDLAALRPVLDLSDADYAARVRSIACVPPSLLALAGMAGAAATAAMPLFDPGFWTTARPELLSLDMLFYLSRQGIIGWLAGHALISEFRATRGFATLGGHFTRVDLFDLRPLGPFASKGLRSAGTWLVASSLVSMFWLSEGVAVAVGPIVIVVLLLSLVVFLYPLAPLRGVILGEKTRELDALREAIRAEPDPLEANPSDSSPRFTNLVSKYQLIENVREWPIETPTILRFAAFALLGLGSWLGGALVERLLEWFVR